MNMKSFKGLTMWKRTLIALCSVSVAASASVWDNERALDAKVDSINAKRGLEIGGSIRAVSQVAMFDTDDDPTGINTNPETERLEFVSADLDFHFRPWENVRANVMLRLGAGMQEYFSSASKTMSVGFANVEGNVGNSLYWVVGDFRQQYSPLTLYSPGIDLMYEPTIFARKRHMAQEQQLLRGNERNLQGGNIQFRHKFNEAVGEFRAEGLVSRLNNTTVLDLSGYEGNILPNDTTSGSSQASNMDKWLLAANFELFPMNNNLYVGVTPMYIFDNEDSYTYTYRHSDAEDLSSDYELQSINPYDTDPQKTLVVSGRLGADIAGFIGNKDLTLDLVGEFAYSSDDVYEHYVAYGYDDEGNLVSEDSIVDSETLNGIALLVTMNAGYKLSDFDLKLVVDFIYNDSNWFNNLAQSPQFFARRILNSDKDGNTIKYTVNSPLYSTFDALYNFTPKFSPTATTLNVDDAALASGQTDSYNIAPFHKNSWTTNIYSRSQLAVLEALSDPNLQLVLPNGLSTSNRTGARGTFTAGWKEAAEIQALFGYFTQVSPLVGYKDVSYMEYGAGAKVDIFKIIGFKLPLEISGSYKHSERSMDTDGWVESGITESEGTAELKSDFINAGLYVQYLPRLGVTAGFQYAMTDYNAYQQAASYLSAPLISSDQMQWMIGLDYTLAKNAWLSLNFGIVTVKNEYNTSALVSGAATGSYNLPDYYDVTLDTSGKYKHEFTQTIVEASINVEF